MKVKIVSRDMEVYTGLTDPGQPSQVLSNPAHSPGPHFRPPRPSAPAPELSQQGQFPAPHSPALLSCAFTESGSSTSLCPSLSSVHSQGSAQRPGLGLVLLPPAALATRVLPIHLPWKSPVALSA